MSLINYVVLTKFWALSARPISVVCYKPRAFLEKVFSTSNDPQGSFGIGSLDNLVKNDLLKISLLKQITFEKFRARFARPVIPSFA